VWDVLPHRFAIVLTCVLTIAIAVADEEAAALEPTAKIQIEDVHESSGIIASRRYPGVFWTHNDSDDSARLFAQHRDGSAVFPQGLGDYHGLKLVGAFNHDWEDIALDDDGNLYVGDIGNNNSNRRDLAIYIVPEPDPSATLSTLSVKRVPFAYPDQTAFPAKPPNFDAEALFWADGKLWLLTKHHGDPHTTLYRFDSLHEDELNVLSRVEEFATDFPVSAADVSRNGKRLAVLTNRSIWIFERGALGESWFAGKRQHQRIRAGNAEGICWDGDDLVITNESSDIFVVHPEDLQR
jgi:hypothetical protein